MRRFGGLKRFYFFPILVPERGRVLNMHYILLAQRARLVRRPDTEDVAERPRLRSQANGSRSKQAPFATRVVSLGCGASFGSGNPASARRSLSDGCLIFVAPIAGEASFSVEKSTYNLSNIDVLVIASKRIDASFDAGLALFLFLQRDVLERHLQEPAFGEVALPIGDRVLSGKAAGRIRAVMQYVFDTIEVLEDGAEAVFAKFGLGRHVVDAVCEALRIDAQDGGGTRASDPGDRLVRLAREHIAAHAPAGPRVEDVARALGVSVRTLQAAFQRRLDQTPYACIQEERLRLAHRALLTAKPHDTVRSIALAHGFAHLGRFSAMIRAVSGRTPREILRKARSASRSRP